MGISISRSILILKFIIQKNFYSQMRLVSFKCIQEDFKLAAIYDKGLVNVCACIFTHVNFFEPHGVVSFNHAACLIYLIGT